ncbi:MAG: Cellulose-binding domain protein [Myxococcaceae bacterium]|nr:Cellulose-binding domain protein [Myxococcaceae bacterium]
MFRRLVRNPNRPWMNLLAASSLLVAACSGEISSPPSLSIEGVGNAGLPQSPNAPTGVTGDTLAQGTRPAGVGDPNTPNGVGWSTRFPKLSNRQWENTAQSLLLLSAPTGLSASFTQEPADKSYETESAAELTIGGDAWTRYQSAAEALASKVVGDAAQLAKITPSGSFTDANAKGAAFIAAFGRRAYRRPLSESEKATYLTLFKAGATLVGGDAYAAGVRVVLEAMLQSPFFLYRVESATKAGANKAQLSGDEVAARLSYALWNTMPSDELFAAASAGELDTAAGVARWAGKMLDDPRAKAILVAFHEQTFQVSAYGTQDKDAALGFDTDALAPVLQAEAHQFFDLVVNQQGGGIAQLLTEPTAFVNQDTAPYYGLAGVTGTTLQKKDLDPKQRAGLLTQLGFLTKNATRSGSDPVHRGLMVVRKVLCDDPDPPPAMFSLPEPVPGLTTREVYEKATACGVGCHDTLINPAGFSFEGFDTLGKVRSTDEGKPVDATGSLTMRKGYTSAEKKANPTTQVKFTNAVDLVTKLSTEPRVHECYARNWMQYVLARDIDPAERGAWELLRDKSLSEASARSLVLALVQLDTFRTRVSE